MATFYDHAKNMSNVAEAVAVAKVRRETIEDGTSYRVEANWKNGERFWWNGGRYDVLQLAKSLVRNMAENVEVTRPNGDTLGHEQILAVVY